MKEQSQIEEMRTAVRGDIERAKRGRRSEALAEALRAEQAPPVKVGSERASRGLGSRLAALFRRG